MALLGFDALGHWPLGHAPDAAQSATLTASVGGLVLTGLTSGFTFNGSESAGSFALTGTSESSAISEVLAAGSFSLGGVSATFSVRNPAAVGSFVFSVLATIDTIGEAVNPAGSFALTGVAAAFSASLGAGPATSFDLTIPGASLARDFVNWFDLPFPAASWHAEGPAVPSWTAVNPPTSSWSDAIAPAPAWSAAAPPSPRWTIDPVQQILPPVSE